MDTYLTVAGNLTADPVPRNTAEGVALVALRLASNTRRFDKEAGTFRDGDPLYIDVTCWRALGVNVAASLRKGDSVIVTGRLLYRTYDDRDGNRRSNYQIDAVAIGPDLNRSAVDVRRPNRPAAEPDSSPTEAGQQPAAAPAEQVAAA